MAHMGCRCGADMWDGDGHVVYDVYLKKDIEEYLNHGKECYTFNDMFEDYSPLTEDCPYFWLCDNCKRVHLWSYLPKKCFKLYKVREQLGVKDMDYIKNLDEFFVININAYCDEIEEGLLKNFIKKNPLTDKKYYVEADLTVVYIVDLKLNKVIGE